MDLMERIKAECEKHEDGCLGCSLHTEGGCLCMDRTPNLWNIEAIRKALGETSDKEEIVVPEKWEEDELYELPFGVPYDMVHDVMKKQNEIIECLEQIKERMK